MKLIVKKMLFFSLFIIGIESLAGPVEAVASCRGMISRNFLSSCMVQDNKAGEDMSSKNAFVKKKVLDNGLTVLVREVHNIPKVSIQVFYNVGSKDEKTGEKGIAHLIEHMVFKGTKKLSETDINAAMHKLSGSSNAFTSYDYTGYTFNMPTQHWQEALPIIAECMTNCTFKDDLLNSEMKAVIQEMKMGKDEYYRYLAFEMLTLIFPDHPYHYPIIGYKQDLLAVRGKNLLDFYKKHYVPNNATLVVVGDVDADNVFELAQEYFGDIAPNPEYKKEKHFFNKDIVSRSVTLYRDVKQPISIFAFVIPGIADKNLHVSDAAELTLGRGKGSRLYRKLVDELNIATYVSADSMRLFDHGVFYIFVEPKDIDSLDKIKSVISDEIKTIAKEGITEQEAERAIKQTKMSYYSNLENIESQAYDIGKLYLGTGDEDYAFTYLKAFSGKLSDEVKLFFAQHLRPAVMSFGQVLPIQEGEKQEWKRLQELYDKEDREILADRVRKSPLEPPVYTKTLTVKEPVMFDFPKAKSFELSNGVKVFYYDNDNDNIPKIDLILELRAKYFYDPDNMQGLYSFVANILTEGTKNYTAAQLADEIETRGMSLSVSPGMICMRMLSEDLPKGLELLEEVLSRPAFEKKEVEKVRKQMLVDLKSFWDDPASVAGQLTKEVIYKDHPYSKNPFGTNESISKIKRKDLKAFYKKYISPSGAKLVIVGDLSGYDLKKILEEKFAKWSGPEVQEMVFPDLAEAKSQEIDYYMNRDQVVVSLANLSIDRKNKDYDKYLLFDQIFGGGVLGSMHSMLFALREKTGLFYSIGGSTIASAGKQPGMLLVRTIVSLDKIKDSEKVIKGAIDNAVDALTEQELDLAKRAIANYLKTNFESNRKIASAFLFLDKYGFSADYFDKRAQQLATVTLVGIKEALKKIMHSDSLVTLRVGRVGKSGDKSCKK